VLFPVVSVHTCLFVESLFSNGCHIFAYFAAIACQRVCMPQYNESVVYVRGECNVTVEVKDFFFLTDIYLLAL
jgi:hypothetical protein